LRRALAEAKAVLTGGMAEYRYAIFTDHLGSMAATVMRWGGW
jgi:hypothetical protein